MFTPNFNINNSKDKVARDFLSVINKIGKSKKIKKGELILDGSISADFFFYIKSGVFKTLKKVNDRNYILGFTFSGDVDGDFSTLYNHSKTEFSIEAIANSEVLICTWAELEAFLKSEQYLSIVNYFLVHYAAVIQNRLIESISITAEERYKSLIKNQPKHVDKIPIADLASYLGITRQSISRIRSSKF
jgi:CRP/FNR family transcriptional regulator, anaerobic regulatory protein